MAESINEIAIKLSVDAAGVSHGFRTAAEEARGFQREIDRFSYAVDKGLGSRKFGPLLDEALAVQSVNDRLAKEKAAQQEFNAWFQAESEKEFQVWYSGELRKEKEAQAFAEARAADADRRVKERIEISAMVAKYASEEAALEKLSLDSLAADRSADATRRISERAETAAMIAAYAAQEAAAERTAMDAAAADRTADADRRTRERQETAEMIARLAAKEAAAERAQADIIAAERMADADQRARERKQLADMVAGYAAKEAAAEAAARDQVQLQTDRSAASDLRDSNQAKAEANAIIQRTLTLNQRYVQQLATLTRLNKTILVDTKQQALNDQQLTTAKTALILATIRQQQAQQSTNAVMSRSSGGFGGAAMAMGQLSYAAEDFIQVLAMGGGLNMALMSASNNLSMVARALIGTSGIMSAVAGFAIPALLIGTGILIQYLLREEDQVDAVTRAYKRLHDELEHTQELLSRQMQHRFNMQDIDDLATYAAALAKLRQEIRDLAKAEAEAAAIEAKIAKTRKEIRDTVAGGTIIAEAQQIADNMAKMAGVHDAEQIAAAQQDVRDLTEAYTELADAMATGTPDEIVRAAEELKHVLENTSEIFQFDFISGQQIGKLDAILGTDDEIAKLEALRELMQELALVNGDMADGADAIAKTQENMNRLLRQETQLRQDNIRFQLEATDAQKEAADIQKQLSDFLGLSNFNPMQGAQLNGSEEQILQAAEFLELMRRNLERQKKELLDEKQRVTPVGGLEQNTYQAQADAFRQVLEATNRQEDPQLTSIDRRLEEVNNQLGDITGFRIIPP